MPADQEKLRQFTQAILAQPMNPIPLIDRATEYLFGGLIDIAIRDLSQAIGLEPEPAVAASAHYLRGHCHHKKGHTEKALEDYNWAIWSLYDPETPAERIALADMSPNHASSEYKFAMMCFFHRGLLLFGKGLYGRAQKDFYVAMVQGPNVSAGMAIHAALLKGITTLLLPEAEGAPVAECVKQACADFSNAYAADRVMTCAALGLNVEKAPSNGVFFVKNGQLVLATLRAEAGFDIHQTVQPDYLGREAALVRRLQEAIEQS